MRMRLSEYVINEGQPGEITVSSQRAGLLSSFRLLIALMMLVMLNLQWLNDPNPQQHAHWSLFTLLIYALVNTGLLSITQGGRSQVRGTALFSLALLDILCLNLLIQANPHQAGTLSLLFILAIIGAAGVLPRRLSLLIAAMATLSVLLQGIFRIVYQEATGTELITAGTLGIIFFISAFAVQALFYRANQHEQLAHRQASDLIELQRLTESIVQQMRTGLLVIDTNGYIQLINEAARVLLELPGATASLTGHPIPAALIESWDRWNANPQQLPTTFRCSPSGPSVQASFTHLISQDDSRILVFLEDSRLITQQAQAMKLASLGRLTGSIAHEIRNPLGAISHAAQLLGESTVLPSEDQHLCNIIKAQSTRVNQVIENVLTLSRRVPNQARLLDLDEHIRLFISAYHNGDHPQPRIDYQSAGEKLMIRFDASQLDQVLTNLFDNGLRHSAKARGIAELMVKSYHEPREQLPRLDIIDTGSGIVETESTAIFEPFYTTEKNGTGLGLYMAREICEAHQTQLCYLRTPAQETCFRLIFAHPNKRRLA